MLGRLRSEITRRELLLLVGTVAVALVLDAVFFSGYYASDDRGYSLATHAIANGELIAPRDLAAVRLAITVPNALVYAMFGKSIAATAWLHVGYHLALVILAYIVGRAAHGKQVGHIAAALTATSPLLYVFAGAVLPDIPAAFWLGITLLLLILARRRPSWRWYPAIGLALGIAYSCKETALIMAVPIAFEIMAAAPRLRDPTWLRNGILVVLGLAVFIALETIALRVLAGEWVFRPTLASTDATLIFLDKAAGQGGLVPFDRMQFAVEHRLLPWIPYTAWLLLVPALVYPSRRGRDLCLAMFFWWPLLYLTVGTMSLQQYVPPSIQTRYYDLVVLPAACMAGWIAVKAYRGATTLLELSSWPPHVWRRTVVAAGAVAFFAVACLELGHNLPRAGNIYLASSTRGFVLGLQTVRTRYAGYPIVLSDFYRYRMLPLLLADGATDIYGGKWLSTALPPPPPFIFLQSMDEMIYADALAGLAGYDLGQLDITTVDIVYPPVSRLEVLSHAAREAVQISSPRPRRRATRGAAIIQLVTHKQAPASAATFLAVPTPLFILPGEAGATIEDSRTGHVVEWWSDDRFSAQFFDGRGRRHAPTYPTSRLDGGSRRLDLSVSHRLLRGDAAPLILYATGYSEAGKLVAETRVESVMSTTTTDVRLSLHSPVSMVAFKITVAIRAVEPGALLLTDPTVKISGEQSSAAPPRM